MSWRIVIGDWESVRDDAQRLRTEVFYALHGFQPEGAEFMEAGIPHILMRCKLAS